MTETGATPTAPSLPASLQHLLGGFDHATEHVVITDHKGHILYANHGAEVHTGYTIPEMLGHTPGELWGGHMPDSFYRDMWHTIDRDMQAFTGEMRNRRKDGTEYAQEVHIVPIIEHGAPIFYIGIELSANDPDHRDGILRSTISDEVQETPTGSTHALKVQWPLQWLLEEGNLPTEQLREIDEYYGSEGALDHLVEDLLTISSIEHANQLPSEDTDLKKILEEESATVRRDHPERFYAVEAPENVTVRESGRLVSEVVKQLVLNATHYTAPGAGKILLMLLRTQKDCIIRCEDNGIGITFNEQKRLFTKFFRGARARETHPQGSGLGLHLVKLIADMRGWQVSCISEPNVGSRFEVKIPLTPKTQAPVTQSGTPKS